MPKGKVYDVTGNKAYQPGGSYHGTWFSVHASRPANTCALTRL